MKYFALILCATAGLVAAPVTGAVSSLTDESRHAFYLSLLRPHPYATRARTDEPLVQNNGAVKREPANADISFQAARWPWAKTEDGPKDSNKKREPADADTAFKAAGWPWAKTD